MFEKQQKIFWKFATFGSKPNAETFPELPECLVWLRFALALNYGYYMGNASVLDNSRGITPLLMALNFIGFAPVVYCSLVLQADSDSYGGKVIFAGLANALALVTLMWIYFYTLEHASEEEKLNTLLALARAAKGADMVDGDVAAEGQETASSVPPMEESEF